VEIVCGEPRDCVTPKIASSTIYELLLAFPLDDDDEVAKLLVAA
jgi:hypothetical protein